MNTKNIEDIYPLSPMQQGMLFHSLYEAEKAVYFEQSSWKLKGHLNFDAFQQAWQAVLDRYTALRTSFIWEGVDEPMQVVHRKLKMPVTFFDWQEYDAAEQKGRLEAYLQQEQERGFDLEAPPLMRIAIVQNAPEEYVFVWNHHHLLLDGWTQAVIIHDLLTLYQAKAEGRSISLPEAQPYRNYISWLLSQDKGAAEDFWRSALAGFNTPVSLQDVLGELHSGDEDEKMDGWQEDYDWVQALLPDATVVGLQRLTKEHHITLNTIMRAALALLMSRYTEREDIVFGATVSGRPVNMPGAEMMVGLFINTLPIRVGVDEAATVLDWLAQLQSEQNAYRQYEYSPLVDIQRWSDVPGNQSLFEVLFVFENYPVDPAAEQMQQSLQIEVGEDFTRTNYPITFAVSPGKQLGVEIGFDAAVFTKGVMERLLGHYLQLLAEMAATPQKQLKDLQMLTPAEMEKMLVAWNQTAVNYPRDQLVHQMVETHATTQSEAVAVEDGELRLTYVELNRQANRLAQYLIEQGVGTDVLVPVCLDRSLELVVTVLAVVKAGGGYVPIDPGYPVERIEYILTDTASQLLITKKSLQPALEMSGVQVLLVDEAEEVLAGFKDENPQVETGLSDLAYAIYTSGSTGKPKGVEIEHGSLLNLTHWSIRRYELIPGDRMTLIASPGFDASAWEVWKCLCAGGCLCIPDDETRAVPEKLLDYIKRREITDCFVPTPMLELLLDLDLSAVTALRTLHAGGDRLTKYLPEDASFSLINEYGPTETTVISTSMWLPGDEMKYHSPPIGHPVDNLTVYVIDRAMRPVPVGVPGELCIGGVGLARGYHDAPDLTAEKFIPDPFVDSPDARLYRTGDLVRYNEDGTIDFLGRIDFQVKIRGFRIELGEIEVTLQEHPAVKQAVVMAREAKSGEKILTAYIVPVGDDADVQGLNTFLKESLPEYMVPANYIFLEKLPLLSSGKVDRKALPEPEWGGWQAAGAAYVAPRSPIERGLADIWMEVLGLPQVGVYDNFFMLGGHSLLATRLNSRIRDVYQLEIPLRLMFESTTIASQASALEGMLREASGLQLPAIQPVDRGGDLVLSHAQKRLWFLDQLAPGNLFYNIPVALKISGKLDTEALEQALNEVVQRHEVLRTIFASEGGTPRQVILDELRIVIPVEDIRKIDEAEREAAAEQCAAEEARLPFDLAEGPLLRARLLQIADEEYYALLTMHHIVSDGWSMGVLLHELAVLYEATHRKQPSPLDAMQIQYADFATWQQEMLSGDLLDRQMDYWREKLEGCSPMLDLMTDYPRPAVQTSQGDVYEFNLPAGTAEKLHAFCRDKEVTLYMVLLAALEALLYRYTGQEDFNIGTVIANRNHKDIEELIGFFVNTLVMRSQLYGEMSFSDLVAGVQETALEAYAHQDLPFEMLVDELQPQRDLSHTPLFQVLFVLEDAVLGRVELPEVMIETVPTHSGASTFDLTLAMFNKPDEVGGYFEYNTDLFKPETIARMAGHLTTLITGILEAPDASIDALPMLGEAERHTLLVDWNQTSAPYPHDITAHAMFERQCDLLPDAAAIFYEDEVISYRELDKRANQLAHYLQKLEVGPEVIVGISLERCPDMVISVLAVMKAGGAYLPLDPAYPRDRLAFMLEDTKAPVLITHAPLLEWLPEHDGTVICLDADGAKIAKEAETRPEAEVAAESLAYVIYTSGSTGLPKGAMLRHRGICNLSRAQRAAFQIDEASRILQFSPYSFDASVWEMFMALGNSGALVITSQEVLASPDDLLACMQKMHVSNVTLPPSVVKVLPEQQLPELRTVIAAGEACPAELVQRWAVGRDFFNAYGPTETTVCASFYKCDADEAGGPPIGRPINNTHLYILDPQMQPVPIGVPGELHVGGVSLARGYLNREELTAQKFVPDPFSDDPQARLYKTGDLVRYRSDSNIEFLGRIDHQVKLRGFRIELGEVEAVLKQQENLKEAVAVVRENAVGNQFLVAYLIGDEASRPSSQALRNALRNSLPEYMVPSFFIYVNEFKKTPSGKLDYKALPALEGVRPEMEQEYVAPRNEIEEMLVGICQELLGLDKVGVYDNFFELGGHSLLATQFISRVRDALGIEVPLRSLFESPNIDQLAIALETLPASSQGPAVPDIMAISRDSHRMKRSDVFSENELAGE
jgi:amino acid adenylation domain-containing protein